MAEEEVYSGLTVTYHDDGIIEYQIREISRPTVDAWYEVGRRHDLEAEESGKHIYRLQFFDNVIPTPYALSRAAALSEISPEIQETQAIVITNSIAYHLVSAFINRLPERHVRLAIRIFNNRDKALEWLREHQKENR